MNITAVVPAAGAGLIGAVPAPLIGNPSAVTSTDEMSGRPSNVSSICCCASARFSGVSPAAGIEIHGGVPFATGTARTASLVAAGMPVRTASVSHGDGPSTSADAAKVAAFARGTQRSSGTT